MIRALIGKELAEHWVSMLLIAVFMFLGFLSVLSMVMFATDGSRPFEALRSFLFTFVVITALVLGNRLVVREYQSKTQLFLEALPLTRLGMITTKYVFGWLIILVPTLLMFGCVALMSVRIDELTGRFIAILLSKTVFFATLIYSFFFLMGLMGRYRIAIYILMLILASVLEQYTSIELNRLGPFALVDGRFAYERQIYPSHEILVTAGLIAICIFLTGLLTVVREGNVASMLAEKMSYREKIFITCLVFGILSCVAIFDERIFKVPFDIPDPLVASTETAIVKISDPDDENREKAQRIANSVVAEVSDLVNFLSIESLPPIFLVQRSDLDYNQFERGDLENADGVLIRANFYHDDWSEEEFSSWFASELVVAISNERTLAEPVRWVLDGFSFYWAQRRGYVHNGADDAKRNLRVAYAMKQGFAENDYNQWLLYRERVGSDIAEAMAWSGLEAIRLNNGDEATKKFLRRVLDPDVPPDIRATIHSYTNSVRRVAKQELNWDEAVMMERWLKLAQQYMNEGNEKLTEIPIIKGSVSYEKISQGSRTVNYEFESIPPPDLGNFSIKFAELPLFDAELTQADENTESFDFEKHQKGSLEPTFPRRSRFMYSFAIFSDVLGCEVITGWQREVMP